MRKLLILCSLVFALGCAGEFGPVKFALGDAYVQTTADGATVVHGGTLSGVFGSVFGMIANAAASVFGGGSPTVVVNPAPSATPAP